MNSFFTLGLMVGISVNDLTLGTTIAHLGMTEVKFPAPLFQGDTINVTTEVKSKRESKSRPNAGLVEFDHRAYMQDGALVAQCRRHAFMRKRPVEDHRPAHRQTAAIVAYSLARRETSAWPAFTRHFYEPVINMPRARPSTALSTCLVPGSFNFLEHRLPLRALGPRGG